MGEDQGNTLVLNDRNFYGFSGGWLELFTNFLGALDSYVGPQSPEQLRQGISEAEEGIGDIEFFPQNWHQRLRAHVQHVYATGVLWIQAEKTSCSGLMLLLWIDEYRRVVR